MPSPENTKIGVTPIRHPMGTTTQHPWLLPLTQRTTRVLPFGLYPDSANKTRLTTTVKVTLKSTLLTSNQKRHPLPMSSSGLLCGKSRAGAHPWCAPSSRRGPLPGPLRGSPRFSLVPPGVAVAATSPTTPDSSRFPGSKGGALRSLRDGMVLGIRTRAGIFWGPGPSVVALGASSSLD